MKNHSSARIVAMLILAAIGIITTTTSLIEQEVRAPTSVRQAPPLVADDNVYVTWWSNNTANGNNEVWRARGFEYQTDSHICQTAYQDSGALFFFTKLYQQ